MTGTNEDVFGDWNGAKPLVSGFVLREGVIVNRVLPWAREYLACLARGGRDTLSTPAQRERNHRVAKAVVRFAKALKELRLATRGLQNVLDEARADGDKESDGRL